jgi:beta-galactosidase
MENIQFPKGFLFGTATASYQVEGAWCEDGKGENIWDRHVHDANGKVSNNETGDVAIDQYHRFKEDFDILKDIKTNSHRFSISWARILPAGIGKINQKGIDHYNEVIDALIERGIEPIVTLYHWDLPAALQEMGGWANRECIKWFENYARICFESFGDRVKIWVTLNEPANFTLKGYSNGRFPPCIRDFKMAIKAAHNALVAHGAVVKLYKKMNQGGKIGIALDLVPKFPISDDPKDVEAAQIANDTTQFFFYESIVFGRHPELLVKRCKELNIYPEIDPKDFEIITEKCDFLGINYYYTQAAKYDEGNGRFNFKIVRRGLELTMGDWELDPEGFAWLLKKVWTDIKGEMPIIITENGYCPTEHKTKEEEINDDNRIDYLKLHLSVLSKAAKEGVDIRGYMLWSAFDNFEWNEGYGPRFGIIHIDYDTLERTPKKSAYWYKSLIESQEK